MTQPLTTTMKKYTLAFPIAAALMLGASQTAGAAVIQSFGANSAVPFVQRTASFELNTTLANGYIEDGLLFSYSGSGLNNNCGYAGIDCYDTPQELSPSFSGNYMATAGANAYLSVRKVDGGDMFGIEWAAGSGYLNLNGYWKTYNDSVLTGAGNFSQPDGAVVGLRDGAGFDEVRYYAFSTPNKQSGFSAAAFDAVRVNDVPEPASVLLVCAGLAGLAGQRRKG